MFDMVVLTGLSSKQLGALVNLSEAAPLAPDLHKRPALVCSRGRRLSPQEIVQILKAYRAGTSMADVAKHHQVKRATVSEVLRRSGIQIREQRQITKTEVRKAARLYGQGWSLARVGEHLDYDTETIRQHLMRHGVVMRSPNQRRHL